MMDKLYEEWTWRDDVLMRAALPAPVVKIGAALDVIAAALADGDTEEEAIATGFGAHLMPFECSAITMRAAEGMDEKLPIVELRFAVADGPCAGQRHDVQAQTLARCIEIARIEVIDADAERMRPTIQAWRGGTRPLHLLHQG